MSTALDPHKVPLTPFLVEASAGTGKTWTITALYLRMVLEVGLEVPKILVITFTRAASGEVRDRIRARLRDALRATTGEKTDDTFANELIAARGQQKADAAKLVAALRSIDEAPVSTIDAFCHRILSERAFTLGLPLELAPAAVGSGLEEAWAAERWLRVNGILTPAILKNLKKEHSLQLSALESIVTVSTRWPNHPIEPRSSRSYEEVRDELVALVAKGRTAVDTVRARWNRRKFAAFIDGLPHRKDGTLIVTGCVDVVDKWLSTDGPPLEPPKEFKNLGSKSMAKRLRANNTVPAHPTLAAIDAVLALVDRYDRLVDEVLPLALASSTALDARRELPERRAELGALGFDQVLRLVHERLEGPGGEEIARELSQQYQAALVDEFQDTDPVQWSILDRIFGREGGRMFLVGDPKQAIYGFRGADIHSYLKAASTRPKQTLSESQRSDRPLVEALNHLFGPPRVSDAFRSSRIGYAPLVPKHESRMSIDDKPATPLRLLLLSESKKTYGAADVHRAIPRLVAREIAALLGRKTKIRGEDARPRHFAVLVRSNAQALQVQHALRDANVPSVLATETSVLHTEEAVELADALAAIVDPRSTRRVRAALTTSLLGLTANELEATDEATWSSIVEGCHEMGALWRDEGFYRAFRALVSRHGIPSRLLTHPGGERRLANLLHLGEILHERASATGHGPEALLAWFDLARQVERNGDPDDDKVAPETMQMRLESDADAVRIATIHKSKGLEYPVVFAPFLWQSSTHEGKEGLLFVPESPTDPARLHLRGFDDGAARAAAKREERSEQMRLAYVALTRACHQLHVVVPNTDVFDTSPLANLLAVEGKLPSIGRNDPERDAKSKERHKRLRAAANDVAASSGGRIATSVDDVATILATHPHHDRRNEVKQETVVAIEWPERTHDLTRTTSFSKLTTHHAAPPDPIDGGTRAQEDDAIEGDEEDDELSDAFPPEDEPEIALARFRSGRDAGNAIHQVFERLDFTTAKADEVLAAWNDAPDSFALDTDHEKALVSGVLDTLETRIPASTPFSLREVAPTRCLREVDFTLPVCDAPKTLVGSKRLAEVLAAHAKSKLEIAYAKHAAKTLQFNAWKGWLRGSVDLFFEHGGKYWVLDWKSNNLGTVPSAYARPALDAVMCRNHYVLQSLLYSVAMHRHLKSRMAGYRFDEHFGGVIYLFVRGTTPRTGDAGVVLEHPQESMIEALSELLRTGVA